MSTETKVPAQYHPVRYSHILEAPEEWFVYIELLEGEDYELRGDFYGFTQSGIPPGCYVMARHKGEG